MRRRFGRGRSPQCATQTAGVLPGLRPYGRWHGSPAVGGGTGAVGCVGLAALGGLDGELAKLLLVALDDLAERHGQALGVYVADNDAVGDLKEKLGLALLLAVGVGHVEDEVDDHLFGGGMNAVGIGVDGAKLALIDEDLDILLGCRGFGWLNIFGHGASFRRKIKRGHYGDWGVFVHGMHLKIEGVWLNCLFRRRIWRLRRYCFFSAERSRSRERTEAS